MKTIMYDINYSNKSCKCEKCVIMDRINTRLARDKITRRWIEIDRWQYLPKHHEQIKTHGGKKGLIHYWHSV